MSSLKPLSRRQVVSAGAWAVPAVAVASAAPSYATSPGPASFALTILPGTPGEPLVAQVTLSEDAFPLAPDSVTLTVTLIAVGGGASLEPPAGWRATPVAGGVRYTAPVSPEPISLFTLNYNGTNAFRFVLSTPSGSITRDWNNQAAARVQDAPSADDSSVPLIELP